MGNGREEGRKLTSIGLGPAASPKSVESARSRAGAIWGDRVRKGLIRQ